MNSKKIDINHLLGKKQRGEKISLLTAYDYPMAKILDGNGVDAILVGDSLGNVALGYRNTIPVTMEEMVIHTRAVARAVEKALVIADMPFGSFQVGEKEALANAIKLVKAGAEAVKIEGTASLTAIRKIIKAGIPVMGHIGFTPQAVNLIGCRVQGKGKEAKKIIEEAKQLAKAGCFALVLEMVPEELAGKITRALKIPTIGIGAGDKVGGQVVVTNDLIGLSEWHPSFIRPKANVRAQINKAIRLFIKEVEG